MQISAPEHSEVFKNTMSTALGALGLKSYFDFKKGYAIGKAGAAIANLPSTPFILAQPFSSGKAIVLTSIRGIGTGIRTAVGGVISWPVVIGAAIIFGVPQIGVLINRHVSAGKCGDVSLGGMSGDAGSGCSVVRAVNYNEEEIGSYCSVVESIG